MLFLHYNIYNTLFLFINPYSMSVDLKICQLIIIFLLLNISYFILFYYFLFLSTSFPYSYLLFPPIPLHHQLQPTNLTPLSLLMNMHNQDTFSSLFLLLSSPLLFSSSLLPLLLFFFHPICTSIFTHNLRY